MGLTIYGTPLSRTFRVLWAAEELGLAYTLVPWHHKGTEVKSPDYLAINPMGTIPAIVDDGVPFFESLAINLYLSRKHGRLWPADVAGEGRAFQWTLWAATEVETPLGTWAYNTIVLPEPERSLELARQGAETLARKLGVLQGALAVSPWLAGPAFTIADLNVAAVLYRGPQFGLDRWPRIKDWHARCYARPGAKAAVALREKHAV